MFLKEQSVSSKHVSSTMLSMCSLLERSLRWLLLEGEM